MKFPLVLRKIFKKHVKYNELNRVHFWFQIRDGFREIASLRSFFFFFSNWKNCFSETIESLELKIMCRLTRFLTHKYIIITYIFTRFSFKFEKYLVTLN